MQLDPEAVRFDTEQIQVEQCMNIGSQQKAIRWVVIVFSAVRINVGCFKNCEDSAACNDTVFAVSLSHGIAKLLCASAFTDLSLDKIAAIVALKFIGRIIVLLVCVSIAYFQRVYDFFYARNIQL